MSTGEQYAGRRVLISGYYGFDNLGDELILDAVSRGLRQAMPGVQLEVLSWHPERTLRQHGLNAVNRWYPAHVLRAISRCDMLISGGGGLLQDTSGALSLWYYLAVIAAARFLGKKVFVYAGGIGPIKRCCNRRLATCVLNRVSGITVRDENSRSFLESIGVKVPVTVTADPVFGLINPQPAAVEPPQNRAVAITLRPMAGWLGDPQGAAQLANQIFEKFGYEAVFIPFHIKKEMPLYEAACKMLRGPYRIETVRTQEECLQAFMGVDAVVTARLHGAIMSVITGRPCIGISDEGKLDGFFQALGLEAALDRKQATLDAILDRLEFAMQDTAHWRRCSADFHRKASALAAQTPAIAARFLE